MLHGKNLQDHWKNLHFSLFGTHQISICSANFCLTPPRMIRIFGSIFRIFEWSWIFFEKPPCTFLALIVQGGVRQKFAEHMLKICSGWCLVPTHHFFSINHRFFPQHFQDPPIFFRKCKFFPLKFGGPPTFLRKIHIYQIFDPLTSRTLSVFGSLFCYSCFLYEFLSFWAIQKCKIVKNSPFWMFFF